MAVTFSGATGENYSRSTGILQPQANALTICGWARYASGGGDTFWSSNGGGNTSYIELYIDAATGNLRFSANSIASTFDDFIVKSSVPDDTWFFWALTRPGGASQSGTGYYAAASEVAFTTASGQLRITNSAHTQEFIARSIWGTASATITLAVIKAWQGAELTSAELWNERNQILPFRTASYYWHPFFAGGATTEAQADYSGNARTLSGGTNSVTAHGPPIPWKASPRQRVVTSGGGGGGTETASVSPVSAAWSVPAVAATIRVTASISPVSSTWSAPAVSPSTKVAADVAPASAVWSAPTVSGVAVLVATVSPAAATWSAQSVSPTIRAAASAAPAAATWSVPAVAAQATVIAAVSPAAVAWSVPATAGRAVLTATVSPVSAAWSVQSPAPTIQASASVAPASAAWLLPAVAAESFVEAEVSPAAATWSAVSPAATIRTTAVVSPATATWSAPSVAGSATAGPTVTSANVNAAGTMLAIHFEELMQGYEGFTLNASGGPVTLTYAGFGGPDNPILYTLSRTISIGETLTLDYAPGDVAEYGFGSPGESLDAFDDFPVTNNSTIGVGSVSPVSATWGVPAVSGQTESVAAAVVSPATATWSVSSVEGRARITALVTPAAVQWSAVAPQATIRARGTLIPAAAAWSVLSPAPTIRARASVSPRAAHWSAPALAGQTDLIPPEYGHVEISDAARWDVATSDSARWDVAATDSRRWRCEVSDTGDPSG